MALSLTTLEDELEDMLDSLQGISPPTAKAAWASAFGTYFHGASLAGVSVISALVDSAATPDMEAAISFNAGDSATEGAEAIRDGISAFWGAIAGNLTGYWPAALPPLIAPPALTGGSFVTQLVSAFGANNAQGITNAQAAANMASVIHTLGGLTGTAVIVTTTTPIL